MYIYIYMINYYQRLSYIILLVSWIYHCLPPARPGPEVQPCRRSLLRRPWTGTGGASVSKVDSAGSIFSSWMMYVMENPIQYR